MIEARAAPIIAGTGVKGLLDVAFHRQANSNIFYFFTMSSQIDEKWRNFLFLLNEVS